MGRIEETEKLLNKLAKSENAKISKARKILGDEYVIITLANWNYEVEQHKKLLSRLQIVEQTLENIKHVKIINEDGSERYEQALLEVNDFIQTLEQIRQ